MGDQRGRCHSGPPPRAWGRRVLRGTPGAGRPVHPHARGDDGPMTRDAYHKFRFTPTRVGTTCAPRASCVLDTVHPHARGDDALDIHALCGLDRFTPTRVGTTVALRFSHSLDRFTPTRVGTTQAVRCARGFAPGSPPRAWGRPGLDEGRDPGRAVHPHARGDDVQLLERRGGLARSTPTRVGTTSASVSCHGRAHGPPPRAWGRHPVRAVPPAPGCSVHPHARGDDGILRMPTSTTAVHPHARGDDAAQSLTASSMVGSPPRAWGRRGRAGS